MAIKGQLAPNQIQIIALQFFASMQPLFSKAGIGGKVISGAQGAHHLTLRLRLDDPLKRRDAIDINDSLALAAKVQNVIAAVDRDDPGLINYQFQLPQPYWVSYTREQVTGLGVGLAEQRKQIAVGFEYPYRPQILVAGMSDAGKTETVQSIAVALASKYTPQQLQMVIIDPHRDYEGLEGIDHVVVMARTPENIRMALVWAGNEFVRRREGNLRDESLLVIVVDEAKDVMADPENLAVAQRIAAEGRKFHCHLVIAIQNPKQTTLPELLDKLTQRYIGAVDDAKTSARLSTVPGLMCHRLSGRGDFYQILGGDTYVRFQVAMATQTDIVKLPHGNGVTGDDLSRVNLVRSLSPSVGTNGPVDNYEADMEERAAQRGQITGLLGIFRGTAADKHGGRPSVPIDPKAIAYYLLQGSNRVSAKIAQEVLDLGRDIHERHRDFTVEIETELRRLVAGAPDAG